MNEVPDAVRIVRDEIFLSWGIRTVFMIFDLIFEFIVDNYEK